MANNTIMIIPKLFGQSGNINFDFSSLAVRPMLRVEITNYTGTTLDLAGRTTTSGLILSWPKYYKYRIEILLRQGILQPVLNDSGVPTVPSYTFDNTTGIITFNATLDFTTPVGENIIIILR
jgi:hypothetical protein